MWRRHELVEIEDDLTLAAGADALRWFDDLVGGDLPGGDLPGGGLISAGGDGPELIDESRQPTPVLPEPIGTLATASRSVSSASRSVTSAIPTSRPMSTGQTGLGWGLGTDGWPRQNSRLVRLLVCDPDTLLDGVVGRRWGALELEAEAIADAEWPRTVPGWLQMPYPSTPLRVELQAQPFHERYCRVDVVLCSQHRRPRRYFDVASRCLSEMRIFERTAAGS